MLTLQRQFERHLAGSRFFNYHDKVVVAVSTGVDSMVLLDLLQQLPPTLKPRLVVAHMNHQLRKQSAEEETYIKNYCTHHQLRLVVKHWAKEQHPQTGIEDAARQARYRFFTQVMKDEQAGVLVTAHHQNDLAETMLMKMTRGGQLPQLVGINDERPFASGKLVRPLLPFSKAALTAYAQTRGMKWYEDETNQELDVQRNRFRHEIIPLLEKENPRLLDHLASYHQQLSDLLKWREEETRCKLKQMVDCNNCLIIKKLLAIPQAGRRLLLERWLNNHQIYDLKTNQLNDLLQLIANQQKPQQVVELPGEFLLIKNYQVCAIKDRNKLSQELQKVQPHVIELEQWYRVDEIRQIAISSSKQFFQDDAQLMPLWLAPDQLPLTLRPWQSTDYLRLKGGGHQRVKRVLINQKVPQPARLHQLVLVDAHGEVVWLLDRKWSWFDRPENYRQQWQPVVIGIKDKEEK